MPHTSNGTKLDCPVHLVLSYIGGKWAILILQELFQGSRRTNEFLSALPGISTKTLTARLRELESDGLVNRTVFPEVPPRVEYSLTPKGQEIQPIMVALNQVGEQWLMHSPSDSRSIKPEASQKQEATRGEYPSGNRPATLFGSRRR